MGGGARGLERCDSQRCRVEAAVERRPCRRGQRRSPEWQAVHDRRRDAAGVPAYRRQLSHDAPWRNRRCLVAAGARSSQRAQGLALHQRGGPSQAGCDAIAGARRTGCGVGSHPHVRGPMGHSRRQPARRRGRPVRRRHRAAHDGGRPRHADCVCECLQPHAGACDGSPARARRALGAGRDARPPRAAGHHGGDRAGRTGCRRGRHPGHRRRAPARRRAAAGLSAAAQRAGRSVGARVRGGPCRVVGGALRAAARLARSDRRCPPDVARGRHADERGLPHDAVAQRARGVRDCARLDAPRRGGAAGPELHQPAVGAARLRDRRDRQRTRLAARSAVPEGGGFRTVLPRFPLGGAAGCPASPRLALGTDLPWTGYDENLGFEIVGRPTPEEPSARFHVAAPGYFETLGIRLEAGRLFTDRDAGRRSQGPDCQRCARGAGTFPGRPR